MDDTDGDTLDETEIDSETVPDIAVVFVAEGCSDSESEKVPLTVAD